MLKLVDMDFKSRSGTSCSLESYQLVINLAERWGKSFKYLEGTFIMAKCGAGKKKKEEKKEEKSAEKEKKKN